jgi:hypothetical protein
VNTIHITFHIRAAWLFIWLIAFICAAARMQCMSARACVRLCEALTNWWTDKFLVVYSGR